MFNVKLLVNFFVIRYYLKGPKKGSLDVFANLPGLPDNLRTSSRGTIWVPLPGVRHGIFLEMLFSSVLFRKLILKVCLLHSGSLILTNCSRFLQNLSVYSWSEFCNSKINSNQLSMRYLLKFKTI